MRTLVAQSRSSASADNLADIMGDMPYCLMGELEAHQNRVVSCIYNNKKNLLATRLVSNTS